MLVDMCLKYDKQQQLPYINRITWNQLISIEKEYKEKEGSKQLAYEYWGKKLFDLTNKAFAWYEREEWEVGQLRESHS